jgi:hypothetical protein
MTILEMFLIDKIHLKGIILLLFPASHGLASL